MNSKSKEVAISQAQLTAEAISNLAVIGGKLTREDDIAFEGVRWCLPEKFQGDLMGAAEWFMQFVHGQMEDVGVSRTFNYRPMDGAHATDQAMREVFGMVIGKKGFFGDPPEQRTINIGYVNGQPQTTTVPWGNLSIPGVRGTLTLGYTNDSERGKLFRITATCRKMDQAVINGFFEVIQRKLESDSIYRGRSFNGKEDPDFIDVEAIDPSKFIYTVDAWRQLNANVLSPITHAAKLRAKGMSPKRVVVLEGEFGVGKTGMTRTAVKHAESYGWTSVVGRPGTDDPFTVIQTAAIYAQTSNEAGSLVILEDFDTFSGSHDPTYVSRLLDAFDGFASKDLNMLLVLTTNHIDRVHKGMLRPGRLDAIISIGAMDRPGVEELCRLVVGDGLAPDVDFDLVFEATEGFAPAYVREAIDRSIRIAVAQETDDELITTEDLLIACESLRPQLELQGLAKDSKKELPFLDEVYNNMISEHVAEAVMQHQSDQTDYDYITNIVHEQVTEKLQGMKITMFDEDEDETGEYGVVRVRN